MEWVLGGAFLAAWLIVLGRALQVPMRTIAALLPLAFIVVLVLGFAIVGAILVFGRVHS